MLGSFPPLVELPGQKHIPPNHEAVFAPTSQQKLKPIPKVSDFTLAQGTNTVRGVDGKQLKDYTANRLAIFKH